MPLESALSCDASQSLPAPVHPDTSTCRQKDTLTSSFPSSELASDSELNGRMAPTLLANTGMSGYQWRFTSKPKVPTTT